MSSEIVYASAVDVDVAHVYDQVSNDDLVKNVQCARRQLLAVKSLGNALATRRMQDLFHKECNRLLLSEITRLSSMTAESLVECLERIAFASTPVGPCEAAVLFVGAIVHADSIAEWKLRQTMGAGILCEKID